MGRTARTLPVPKATPKTARPLPARRGRGRLPVPKATPKTARRCLPDEDVGGCPRSAACLPRKLGRGQWLGVRPSKTYCAEALWASALWAHGLFGGALWRSPRAAPLSRARRGWTDMCDDGGLHGNAHRLFGGVRLLGISAPKGMGASGSLFFLGLGPGPPNHTRGKRGAQGPNQRKKRDPEAPIPEPRSKEPSPPTSRVRAGQTTGGGHGRPDPSAHRLRGGARGRCAISAPKMPNEPNVPTPNVPRRNVSWTA